MFAHKLLLQNWYGEVQGVRILSEFRRSYEPLLKTEPTLSHELDRQIRDEIRHAHQYRKIMKRMATNHLPQVEESWKKILNHVLKSRSFSTVVIGVYGLIEPFNLVTTEALTLSLLSKSDQSEVKEILGDEVKHVAMMPLFESLITEGKIQIDAAECKQMIRLFLSEQRDGIRDDRNERVFLPKETTREFLGQVAALSEKIKQWA